MRAFYFEGIMFGLKTQEDCDGEGLMTLEKIKEILNKAGVDLEKDLTNAYGTVTFNYQNGKFVHGKFDISFKPDAPGKRD
jgi:hypothetical protein